MAFAAVRTLSPEEATVLGMPAEAAAYVCVTGTCGAPVRDPTALRDAYTAIAASAELRFWDWRQPQSR